MTTKSDDKYVCYRITGYFRSRNFRITHVKLNFEGFIFVHFQLQDNLSIQRNTDDRVRMLPYRTWLFSSRKLLRITHAKISKVLFSVHYSVALKTIVNPMIYFRSLECLLFEA